VSISRRTASAHAFSSGKITLEPQAPGDTHERLTSELKLMADWLELESVDQ
jgi:hypothetical protein